MRLITWIGVPVTLLAGCLGPVRDPASPYFDIPPGTRVVLAEPIVAVAFGRGEFTTSEEAAFRRETEARTAYMAALDAEATFIETFEPNLDAVAFLERKHTRFVEEQTERDALATGPSGKGRLSIGGSAAASTPSADATGVPSLVQAASHPAGSTSISSPDPPSWLRPKKASPLPP